MNITKAISVSTLLSILMLLFGCQSRGTEPDMLRQEPQNAHLRVIQVGDMQSLDALEAAHRAQERARMRAAELSDAEQALILANNPNPMESVLAPYRTAVRMGYFAEQDADTCTVWVRAGAQYQDNLGRAVAACLEAAPRL